MSSGFEFLPIRTNFSSDSEIDNSFLSWQIDYSQCYDSNQSESHTFTKELEYNRGDEFNGLDSQILFSNQNMNSLDNVQSGSSYAYPTLVNQPQPANIGFGQNSGFTQNQIGIGQYQSGFNGFNHYTNYYPQPNGNVPLTNSNIKSESESESQSANFKKRLANCFLQNAKGKNVLKAMAVFKIHNMINNAANVPPVIISCKYKITQYYKDFAPFQDQIIDAIEKNIDELRNTPIIQQIYKEIGLI